ncbi:hypothetical protein X740_33070 [Mesorhizobium sp. LNHC221B00]|nr:hypothetical protein X740_33070 [Mesorhizobium sp. LNHC221B00]
MLIYIKAIRMKYENSNREEEHGPMKLATIHIGDDR